MPQINNLLLNINNVQIAYVPESLMYNKGGGKRVINANSAGGGGIAITLSRDLTEGMSMLKFELRNTTENSTNVDNWFNSDSNSIRLSGAGESISFTGMVMEEDPDRPTASDGTIEIMFKGNPAV